MAILKKKTNESVHHNEDSERKPWHSNHFGLIFLFCTLHVNPVIKFVSSVSFFCDNKLDTHKKTGVQVATRFRLDTSKMYDHIVMKAHRSPKKKCSNVTIWNVCTFNVNLYCWLWIFRMSIDQNAHNCKYLHILSTVQLKFARAIHRAGVVVAVFYCFTCHGVHRFVLASANLYFLLLQSVNEYFIEVLARSSKSLKWPHISSY